MNRPAVALWFFGALATQGVPAAAEGPIAAPEIDYGQPRRYLAQGTQTAIDARHVAMVASIGIRTKTVAEIRKIIDWKKRFRNVPAGGRHVGVRTVNDILASNELTGCHDHGILLAALLRHFGFPAIMVDATGIAWSRLPESEREGFSGHVFVETYVDGKWILLDSTTDRSVTAYDPLDAVIGLASDREPQGYYVMFKGVDPAGYGIRGIKELNDAQLRFAERLRAEARPSR